MTQYICVGVIVAVAAAIWRLNKATEQQGNARREELAKEAREKHQKAEDERERRSHLQRDTPKADKVLAQILLANLELRNIPLTQELGFNPARHLPRLREWRAKHSEVLDFSVFSHLLQQIERRSSHGLSADHLESLFDDFDHEAVSYADKRFGIKRYSQFVDGEYEGGIQFEMPGGGFEYPRKWFERILIRLPGADRGWIYVLTNSSMPGLVKIGFTKGDPEKRAFVLSQETGVPTPFVVAFSECVGNCRAIEMLVHSRLSEVRVSAGREFFRMSVDDAIATIRATITEFAETDEG